MFTLKHKSFTWIKNVTQINKYAFSGGQDTVELHRKLGGNIEVDVCIKYLNFFLDDDEEYEKIKAVSRVIVRRSRKF